MAGRGLRGRLGLGRVNGDANVFAGDFDFTLPTGVSICSLGKRASMELLGATVYELQPGARWADLHLHYANEELILVVARILRVFKRDDANPIPPDA